MPIATYTSAFSRAWHRLSEIVLNFDWLIALFPSIVIGWSNSFGFEICSSACVERDQKETLEENAM